MTCVEPQLVPFTIVLAVQMSLHQLYKLTIQTHVDICILWTYGKNHGNNKER